LAEAFVAQNPEPSCTPVPTSSRLKIEKFTGDGFTFTVGTADQVDPFNFRQPGAHYDPKKFAYFGGIHRGGNALLINREAEKRLYDKSAAPVVMGSVGSWPRAANQVTLWGIAFLGWNARWVTGYAGSNDVILALRRGEIDMTATANLFQVKDLLDSGKFRIINQSGSLENGRSIGRPDFGDVPMVTDMLAGKINYPLGQKAFKYWFNVTALNKILAVAPGTPAPIVVAYRDTFRRSVEDPEFAEIGGASAMNSCRCRTLTSRLWSRRWPIRRTTCLIT
jgi:hypothetical protein